MRYGLFGLMFLLTGCGLFGPDDELSADEAEALLLGIRSLVQEETAEIIALENETTVLLRCPSGGQARVTVEERAEAGSPVFEIAVVIEPEECAFQSETYDFFIPDGLVRDSLAIEFSKSFESGLALSGGTTGTVDWRLDKREGSCDIAMDLHAEAILAFDDVTVEGEYVGTVCGHDIKIDRSSAISAALSRCFWTVGQKSSTARGDLSPSMGGEEVRAVKPELKSKPIIEDLGVTLTERYSR